mgnify:CR=1 FL=1
MVMRVVVVVSGVACMCVCGMCAMRPVYSYYCFAMFAFCARAAGEYLSFSASVYLDCPAEQMFQCTADKNKEVEARGSLPSPHSLSLLSHGSVD